MKTTSHLVGTLSLGLIGLSLLTSQAQICIAPPAGLVSWWAGNGNATDLIGSNHGTLVGNATYASGKVGQAATFDGNGDAIIITNHPSLQLQTFTIEAWIKRSSTNQVSVDPYGASIVGYGEHGYILALNPEGYLLLSKVGVGGVTSSFKVSDLNFHHVAVARDGTSVVFYLDGQASTPQTYVATFEFNTNLGIGNRGDLDHGGFLGLIDEASIYNRALTTSEVQGIFDASSAGKCQTACAPSPSNAISWWTGDGNAVDYVGTNNGILVGNAGYTSSKVGQGFTFDGNSDAINVGNPTSLQLQNLSIEGWIKRSSTNIVSFGTAGNGHIFGYGQNGYVFGLKNDGTLFLAKAGSSLLASSFQITDTNFHHVAVSKTNDLVTFYLDGTAASFSNYNPSFSFGTSAAIGARVDVNDNTFFGQVDELAVYGRVITGAEVQSIFNSGNLGKCKSSPPIIVTQPISKTVEAGQTATFNVLANNATSYQWQFNGSNIVNATSSTLTIPNVTTNNSGVYAVSVSNINGAVLSSNATLNVIIATCVTPPSGLVSWWSGNGNAFDSIGTNNGTLVGNATYTVGKVGQAFSFDGNDAVIISNTPSLRLQNFTIEVWMKRSSTNAVSVDPFGACLFGYGEHGYVLALTPSGVILLSKVNVSAVTSPFQVTDLNFHHVAVTKNGNTVVFYLDGQASAPQTYDAVFDFITPVGIGDRGDRDRDGFLGVIDEVAIYNRALTGAEIQSIHTAGSAGKCNIGVPIITQQPISQTVEAGQSATFTVVANNATAYQWQFNGSNIVSATSSALTLSNVTTNQAGTYAALVSNGNGSVTSSNAMLVVTVPTCTAPVSGLVSWWPADGTATDFIGINNGTLVGNANYTVGKVAQAFTFDGSGDAINLSNPPSLRLQNFSIEAWIKRSSTSVVSSGTGGNGHIFGYGENGYVFGVRNDGALFLAHVGQSLLASAFQINDTNYHHVAVSKTNGSVMFYVDGVAAAGGVYNPTFSFNTPAAIGARADLNDNTFLGQIDEVAVYNRVLTSAEVQAIYAAGSAGKCKTSPPIIVQQPTSQTVDAGETATFTVLANHADSYQWQFNGSNIVSATTSALSLSNVTTNEAGLYAVLVSNTNGATLSSNAVLTVLAPTCSPVSSGAISWWSGNDEGADRIGSNHGTLAGNATYAAGKVGQAFSLDGAGDALSLGNPANLRLQHFTIEAWIKRNNANQASQSFNGGVLFGYGMQGYAFGIKDNGQLYLSKVGASEVSVSAFVTNTAFHHVAVTKTNGTVTFYLDGVAFSASSYNPGFTFATDVAVGSRGDLVGGFWGLIDELSVYNRVLTPAEIQAIYSASGAGKCAGAISPFFIAEPLSLSVTRDASATFSAVVGGSVPFTYQWMFNGTNIAGATTASLTLTNVQLSQAGNYALSVSNAAGSITSSNAVLTVTLPPAAIRVIGTNVMSGRPVHLPVTLTANGDENALGFSLNFSTLRLGFESVTLGSGASGASLLLNTNQLGSGRLGIAVALPTGATFAAGTQEVVVVHFSSPIASNPANTTISFGDQPTIRQLSNPQAQALAATYASGTVSLAATDFEADTTPRPTGDRILSITDWVQAGRFSAQLDIPAAGEEFQRADCAPSATSGDGQIKVTDWVQAGRYAAGLDAVKVAGGPTAEAAGFSAAKKQSSGLSTRELSISSTTGIQGLPAEVVVNMQAQGDENAVGFSLSFDATKLVYSGLTAGTGAATASFNVNTNNAASGKLGLTLALPIGGNFAAGKCEIVKLQFIPTTAGVGTSNIAFADQPVPRAVSDSLANELSATYVVGAVVVNPLPSLTVLRGSNSATVTWPAWAQGFSLQSSGTNSIGGDWADVIGSPQTNEGNVILTLPLTKDAEFFRLRRP